MKRFAISFFLILTLFLQSFAQERFPDVENFMQLKLDVPFVNPQTCHTNLLVFFYL